MSDNVIKKSIGGIKSDDELKLRMLANIKRKAAEQEQSKQTDMKPVKIVKWTVSAAACLAAVVIAAVIIPKFAVPNELPDELLQMGGSPIAEVNSAKELEERLGFAADAPTGAEKTEYFIINGSIAEIRFFYGKNAYCLRASEQTDDFSGLYGTAMATEQLDDANNAILTTVSGTDKAYLKLTWEKGKTFFVLINTDGGGTEEIKEIYGLLK